MRFLIPNILKNLTNSEILRAIELNWVEFFKSWGKLDIEGVEYEDREEFFKFISGIPYFRLNGVINAQIQPEIVEETVKNIFSSFEGKKLPFLWILGPSSSPDNLR